MPITPTRGHTSKHRLQVDWVHPVPPRGKEGETRAAGPLSLADALDVLWEGDDGRPLLVLRECPLCQGTDSALFSRSLKNDKTMLLTRWFRTVKLPAQVTEPTHPFYNVFASNDLNKTRPHLFLLADRNSKPVAFTGAQTQSQLWRAMFKVLRQRYAKDPSRRVRKWLRLLDRYDAIDVRRDQLREDLLVVRAKHGPESTRARKLTAKLAELDREYAEVVAEEKRVRDLGLLPPAAPKRQTKAGRDPSKSR